LSTSETTVEPRSGLLNVVDIVVAPNAAFARLRVVPSWGWAFLVTTVLAIAGSILTEPAVLHALGQTLPAQMAQQMQNVEPAQRDARIQQTLALIHQFWWVGWIFVPIFILAVALIQALIMQIANAAGHGDGTFGRFFALAVTIEVVGYGLLTLLQGIIALVRGPDSFDTPAAVTASVPGLAMLAPGAGTKLLTFLAFFNVVSLWTTALLALGMIAVARIPRVTAWATAGLTLLLTAAVFAAIAR
jgi:hypothetical protein